MERLGRKNLLSQEFLNFVVYKINSHVSKETGSAIERFFGRPVQTYIPTLVKKSFDQAAAIRRRSEEQLEIAQKLGRRSADVLKKNDLVVLGLINLEESSMGGPGIFEIISIILLALGILLTCHYCNRRFKKSRRREMHSAVQEGMNANNTSVGYRAD